MNVYEVSQGTSPVILAFPHTGTEVPQEIWNRLNANGQILADTDWHIHDLYAGLLPQATTVRATFHRYVIDANRDPEGTSLYPGQNTTGLVPETDFDGKPIWKEGEMPSEADIAYRVQNFHAPYHAALLAEIERVKALHGVAVVYDCHSIRSLIPFLFEGRLPDFNTGTDMGRTCDPAIEAAAADVAAAAAERRRRVVCSPLWAARAALSFATARFSRSPAADRRAARALRVAHGKRRRRTRRRRGHSGAPALCFCSIEELGIACITSI